MRLSILYRRPLSDVLDWPENHVALIAEYMAREPAPDERIEIAVAQLCATYVNAHRKKGAPAHPVVDFLPFRDAWKVDEPEESIFDLAMSFGAVKRADNYR